MAASTKKRSSSSEKSRSVPIVGIVLAVVAVLAVIAVVFAGNTEPGNEYGEPEITGELPPTQPLPNSSFDPTPTGETAPTILGEDFDEKEVRIENDGRAKAIVFLAHWCNVCQAEVPAVQAWLDSGGGVEGVDLYSVATNMNSTRDNFPPSEWLDREGWTAPVIRDDATSSAFAAYGDGGVPLWVFVNSDGTVAARFAGSVPIDLIDRTMQSLT